MAAVLNTVQYKKFRTVQLQDIFSCLLHRAACIAAACTAVVASASDSGRFVTREGSFGSLDGRNIALWQSHGWYFEQKLDRWEWQRARIFQTVEDLYPQSYVLPFLIPMLENAGAYVMAPRERDTSRHEVIVDGDGGFASGDYAEHKGKRHWETAPVQGFGYAKQVLEDGDNPFRSGTARVVKTVDKASDASKASWNADIPADGVYAVYVSYVTLPESADDVVYRVNSRAGTQRFTVNQRMGGGTWVYLGHFPLKAGRQHEPIVELDNVSATHGVVTADAVKIGGGMGNVARRVSNGDPDIDYEYSVSGYPRFAEGARYWLQWAGVPDSVYSPTGGESDYNDDYRCRGMWVNWLAGGSPRLPKEKGLNIPVDMSLAFHTDAGTTMDDTTIGTLGIYCTEKGRKFADGRTRYLSHDLTDAVMTSVVSDIRALYEPDWTRRQMWDKSYAEARIPQVPAILLELLSHQNFADMKYGLDPGFRFTVSRAIYKGIVRYFAAAEGSSGVVQPLPVNAFAIVRGAPDEVVLSWSPAVDELEPTAMPSDYIVEERLGDEMAFRPICRTGGATSCTLRVDDDRIHSYRIVACNEGGRSFPSEVLAACLKGGKHKECVTVVNGFTRVSGPDTFDAGAIAGFYDARDHGVPYISDINYIGSQTEFRRDIPWMDDDAAGFGASRANYEDKVIAGNTFDYPYVHGRAIVEAGYPFVSCSLDAFVADTVSTPPMVDLILGKQKEIIVGRGAYGPRYKAFPAALQQRLAALAANGTDIFVSGAFVATDLWDNPRATDADRRFATDLLGYHWRTGQAAAESGVFEVKSRFKAFGKGRYDFNNTLNEDCYVVESPDSFYPSDPSRGATIMRYGENNLIAATAFDAGAYRTVVLGFPFETIVGEASKASLMRQILKFFTEKQ